VFLTSALENVDNHMSSLTAKLAEIVCEIVCIA